MSKKETKIIETMTFMAELIKDLANGHVADMDIERLTEMMGELNKEEEPIPSFHTGKEVILFYKSNEDTDIENPIVTILGEVEGFGLYVEFEDGNKEVVSFTQITGWGEWNPEQ
jgi:hypothetical protein